MCLEKLRRLQARTEVTTTTLWVATIRHNHTEDLSGEFCSCLSRRIQREGRRAGSRAVKMTAPEKHCEQIDVIKRAVKLPRLCKYLKTAQHNYNNSASSSGASFFAWQRRARNEWLVMNRKGPWKGPVVSFPPSFARTFSSKERRLGTRQIIIRDRDCWPALSYV